jgi:hypothetical protein
MIKRLNLKRKSAFTYAYFGLAALNIAALFFFYQFINKYVYETFFLDRELFELEQNRSDTDINVNKFNLAIEAIDAKAGPKGSAEVNNIFP